MGELNQGERHLLFLIRKDRGADGWTQASEIVFPLVAKLPKELVETKPEERKARLTQAGETVLDWT